ncbi:MAG TPA: AbrB/MazE/SpoVT family DNA-binding domain-containing protein [Allosphingosinicella sp.]|jgi:putative addiction module antidote
MNALTIKKIGNSAGLILPKDVLAQLGAEVGDTLSVVRTPRGIELAAADPEFDRQMAIARQVMEDHRQALRELAK